MSSEELVRRVSSGEIRLQSLPWHERTPDVVLAAITRDPMTLSIVPPELQTREMVLAALTPAAEKGTAHKILSFIAPQIFDNDWIFQFCEKGDSLCKVANLIKFTSREIAERVCQIVRLRLHS
jgi:hypothetical protein